MGELWSQRIRSMPTPKEILDTTYQKVSERLDTPFIRDPRIFERLEVVCLDKQNRAGVRFLLACTLAKLHRPEVDIRKPYTEIGDGNTIGCNYDLTFVAPFVTKHHLPCNPTTAFLTPALRTATSP